MEEMHQRGDVLLTIDYLPVLGFQSLSEPSGGWSVLLRYPKVVLVGSTKLDGQCVLFSSEKPWHSVPKYNGTKSVEGP